MDHAAANLLALRDNVNAAEPLALRIITRTGCGIVRRDGVLQIPSGALCA